MVKKIYFKGEKEKCEHEAINILNKSDLAGVAETNSLGEIKIAKPKKLK